MVGSKNFRAIHTGVTSFISTSTSMATMGLGLERATRLGGPDSLPSSSNKAARACSWPTENPRTEPDWSKRLQVVRLGRIPGRWFSTTDSVLKYSKHMKSPEYKQRTLELPTFRLSPPP